MQIKWINQRMEGKWLKRETKIQIKWINEIIDKETKRLEKKQV